MPYRIHSSPSSVWVFISAARRQRRSVLSPMVTKLRHRTSPRHSNPKALRITPAVNIHSTDQQYTTTPYRRNLTLGELSAVCGRVVTAGTAFTRGNRSSVGLQRNCTAGVLYSIRHDKHLLLQGKLSTQPWAHAISVLRFACARKLLM